MVATAAALATITAVVAPFSGTPNPTFTADTFRMNTQTKGSLVRHVVAGPLRFSSNPANAALADVMLRLDERLVGATRTTKGRRIARPFQTWPDVASGPDDLGLKLAQFAVTEARAGKLTLAAETLAGRATLRAEIDLPANTCRDLPEGTATLWLTKTTLLPKRLEIERDGETTTFTYTFEGFNRSLSLGAVPKLGSNPERINQGFLRRTPEVAAGPLAFQPRLPATLPTGFKLVASGWASKGARTGAGNANKADTSLFSAVYAKGWERIELTQRVASNGTWARDPFSRLCLGMQVGRTLVNNRGAKYGIGPEIPSHLWWREGSILFTVSGPLPKKDLKVIAESLKPI